MRPNPPCSGVWWQEGNSCVQTCPLACQERWPDGNCKCGLSGCNSTCIAGHECINNTCRKKLN